jgi:hypothetical protein
MTQSFYVIRLKGGAHFKTDMSGNVLYDGIRNIRFSPDGGWKILGFSTRHNATQIIPIADASRGVSIGQGWVHDLDHGTHRMWGHPKNRRAVSVAVTLGDYDEVFYD